MATDHYAPCPCGSGKKLKFCKCVDNPQDLDKINRLIEGGQEVAALDRINQLLKKTPNAAWLLAIKAELSIAMGDFEMFRETANRFHKLKPDNPLALIMQSLVYGQKGGNVEQAAQYLLQGLAESRESLSHMALTAARMILANLTSEHRSHMGAFWEEFLQSMLSRSQVQFERPFELSDQNLLIRRIQREVEVAANGSLKERLNEVQVLTRSYRFEQAEKKVQAILRDFPDQPAPLKYLLRAQYGLLNQAGAAATSLKLSENDALSLDERAWYYALWLELDSEQPNLDVPIVVHYAEIDSDHRAMSDLSKLDFLRRREVSDEFMDLATFVGSEVMPQAVYDIYESSVKPTAQLIGVDDGNESAQKRIQSEMGLVALFGKETDQPARAVVFTYDTPSVSDNNRKLLEALQMSAAIDHPIEMQVRSTKFSRYLNYLSRQRQLSRPDGESLPPTIRERDPVLLEEFLAIPFKELGNQTLPEAAKQEHLKLKVLGYLLHFACEQRVICNDSVLDEMFSRLGQERARIHLGKDTTKFESGDVMDFVKLDLHDLHQNILTGLHDQARNFALPRLMFQAAEEIVARRDGIANKQVVVAAYLSIVDSEANYLEQINALDAAEQLIEEMGQDGGDIAAARFHFLAAAGKREEATQALQAGLKKYPENQVLLNILQSLMQFASRMTSEMEARHTPALSQAGLVLPGEAAASSTGESKLWLPGS